MTLKALAAMVQYLNPKLIHLFEKLSWCYGSARDQLYGHLWMRSALYG
jgi:hypothetical protein